MKKNLFFIILISLSLSGYSQLSAPIAVDDTVFFSFGETITFNPTQNDYDTTGLDVIIDRISDAYGCDIISFNDTTVTFKMNDYMLGQQANRKLKIQYELETVNYPIPVWGNIYLFNKDLIIDTLQVNQIRTPIYPMNIQFWDAYFDGGEANYHYPKDSSSTTIFNSGLWIGGKSADNELHIAAERFRQVGTDFWPGPLSVDGYAATDSVNAGNWLRTWKVSRVEINNHIRDFSNPDYEMPEAILNWPAHGDADKNQDEFIAPFVDVDQDLEYRPELGDYPFIKGDVTVFFVYNDQLEHTETEGLPMGVEIHCMAWALEDQREEIPYNSTVFYSYKIINRSTSDYYDTYLGVFTDFDLGYAWDDYVGCHVDNGNFYVYNGRETDGSGEPESFGDEIPSQSTCILGGPFMDEDFIDNPSDQCDESVNGAGFGDGIADNERYGMTSFSYFNGSGVYAMSDPQYAPEYYSFIKGEWKDNSSFLYGGNGHYSAGGDSLYPTKFMFPDDSDDCHWGTGGLDPGYAWTDASAGNQYGDRRGLASMGPFTFEAGSVEYLDIAYVTAPYTEEKASKELLQDYIAEIRQDYLENPMNFGFQYTGIEEVNQKESLLIVYPNPIDGDEIRFEIDESTNTTYVIYNTAGQVVQSGSLPAQSQQLLNVGSLNNGWYLLEIKTNEKTYRSKLIK
jgi:hypothetical protein